MQQKCASDAKRLSGSLEHGLAILVALADHDEMSASELAAAQGVHRSTITRLLQTLEEMSFVIRGDGNRWRIGPRFVEIGARALGQASLRDLARPIMRQLAEATNESVQLTIRSGDEMFVIDVVESSQAVRVGVPLGHRAPLYCTATGKALLAYAPEPELAAYLDRLESNNHQDPPFPGRAAFLADLTSVRARGYSINDEEHLAGVRFVGAPIFDLGQHAIAALLIGAPALRLKQEDLPGHGELVRQGAHQISEALRFQTRSSSELRNGVG